MDEEDCMIVSEAPINNMSAKKLKQGRLPFAPVDKSAKKKRKLSNDDPISKVSKVSCPEDHCSFPFSKHENKHETTKQNKLDMQTTEEKQSSSNLQPDEKENINKIKSLNNKKSIDKKENSFNTEKQNIMSQEEENNIKECNSDIYFKSKNMKIKFFNSKEESLVPAHYLSNESKALIVNKDKNTSKQIKSSDKLNKNLVPNAIIEMFQKIEEKGCKKTADRNSLNSSEEITIVEEIPIEHVGKSENLHLKQCHNDDLVNSKSAKDSIRNSPKTPISSKKKALFATPKTPVNVANSVDNSSTPIQNKTTAATTPNLKLSLNLEGKSPGLMKTPTSKRKLNSNYIMRESEKKKKIEEKEKLKLEKEIEKKQKEDEKLKAKEEKNKLKLEELEAKRLKKEEEKQKKDEEKQKREEEKQKKEEERLRREEDKLKKEEEKLKKEEERQKKEEERIKREEERKLLELEAQDKKKKEKAKFAQFFLSKKIESPIVSQPVKTNLPGPFMKFQVKENMRMAPIVRQDKISEERKTLLDLSIRGDNKKFSKNYLEHLKDSSYKIGRSCKTYPALGKFAERDCEILDDDEDEISGTDIIEGNKVNSVKKIVRAKFLQFCENKRPAFYGTWSKKPQIICGRKPFGKEQVFDYAYDSDEDWEEEETGESLSDSEGEGEEEAGEEENDQYEVDNDFFVPHGYLSDDEGKDDNEVEDEEAEETGFKDENMQKEQLKLKQAEFELEMKQETKKLKPKVYGCVWMGDKNSHSAYDQLMKILSGHRSMILFGTCPIKTSSVGNQAQDEEAFKMEEDEVDESGKVKFAKSFPESAVPDLIRLIHGNAHTKRFLMREFSEFWKNKCLLKNPDEENCCIALRKIEPKIQELGTYGKFTEDGISHKYRTWFVSKVVREKYGLNDLDLKNTWTYTIPPKIKRHRESLKHEDKEDINIIEKEENEDQMDLASEEEPHKKSSAVNLITRFTKVLNEEEKEDLLKKSMLPLSTLVDEDKTLSSGKNRPIGNVQDKNEINKLKVPINSSPANKCKKRISLLSVPRNSVSPNNFKPKNSIMSFLNVKEKAGLVKSDEKIIESSSENCITID